MQDAFISEQGDSLGAWKSIGYEIGTMQSSLDSGSTKSFGFGDGLKGGKTLSSTPVVGWTATSLVALNNCAKGSTWTLKATSSTTGNGATWAASIDSDNCKTLTPQFESLSN